MGWIWTPYAVALLASALVSASLAGYGIVYLSRHGMDHSLVAFVALAASTAWWSLLDAVQMSLTTLDAKLVVWMANVGPGMVGATWLLFAVTYTDNEQWLRHPALWVAVGGAVAYEFVLEPSTWLHGLIVTGWYLEPVENFYVLEDYNGWLFSVWLAWGYGLMLAGLALFVRMAVRNRGTLRTQALVVLAGTVGPLSLDVAYQTGLLPIPDLNLSSIAFSLAAVVFAVAIFRYRLLDVAPVARERVIDGMRDGYLVVDDRGRVVDLNPAAGRFVDVDPDDAIGTAARSVLPGVADPDDAGSVGDEEPTSVDGGVAGIGREGTGAPALPDSWEFATDVEGRRRHVETGCTPLAVGERSVGRLVVLRDVTERTEREQQLRRQNERLDEFASVVSHDLRNPLTVARGYLEVARESPAPGHFDEIEASLDRMAAIIDDVLTLARQGETVGDTEPVDVELVAREAWHNVDTPEAALAVAAGTTVEADDDRLQQLFENLFRNAVEHAGPDVRVTVGGLDGDPGFYVADDGPGVPAEEREAVFDSGFTTREDGTGFGLAIVSRVAEAHGWSVDVTEAEGGGARFELRGVERP